MTDSRTTVAVNMLVVFMAGTAMASELVDNQRMALVPAGTFQMGDTFDEGDADEQPVHTVYVDAFYAGKYEVTNSEYAEALNWAMDQGLIYVDSWGVNGTGNGKNYCRVLPYESYSEIEYDGTFSVIPGKEDHPVGNVTWFGAAAYANWRSMMEGLSTAYDLTTWTCRFNGGYRLLTEAEWEKAARGGVAGQRFPWGDTINHSYANYAADGSRFSYDTSPYTTYTLHPDYDGNWPHNSNPAGAFAANGYGLHDMAGNVLEWCNDRYAADYYSQSPSINPRGPSTGSGWVMRGWTWRDFAEMLRCAQRYGAARSSAAFDIGFRLALDAGLARADFDSDNHVNADDLTVFDTCRTGADVTHDNSEACRQADFDADGDVDQSDFGIFQRCFSGDQRAQPDCGR